MSRSPGVTVQVSCHRQGEVFLSSGKLGLSPSSLHHSVETFVTLKEGQMVNQALERCRNRSQVEVFRLKHVGHFVHFVENIFPNHKSRSELKGSYPFQQTLCDISSLLAHQNNLGQKSVDSPLFVFNCSN
ncbi:hypothetical protein ACHWQZ_G001210 [Mnemiopsis leidyi]